MEYSVVNKSALVSDFRIDSECYKKIYLNIEKLLLSLPHTKIGHEVKNFSKGAFDINADCYSATGVPFRYPGTKQSQARA